jgi:hypothetical protein
MVLKPVQPKYERGKSYPRINFNRPSKTVLLSLKALEFK